MPLEQPQVYEPFKLISIHFDPSFPPKRIDGKTMRFLENTELLLSRQETGEVSIRWNRLLFLTALIGIFFLVITFAHSKLFNTPFRPLTALAMTVIILTTWLTMLYFAKRKVENKPMRQVSTRAMFAGLTGMAIFFAITSCESQMDRRMHASHLELETQLKSMIGPEGKVSVNGNPVGISILSVRSDFNDDDLQQILSTIQDCSASKAPINFLDLSGTQVTDAGVAQLVKFADLDSLTHLLLDGTLVTDRSIDFVQELRSLMAIYVTNTAVTDERLLDLKRSQDQLIISPNSYQKLIPATPSN